jgi:hypothetical protein
MSVPTAVRVNTSPIAMGRMPAFGLVKGMSLEAMSRPLLPHTVARERCPKAWHRILQWPLGPGRAASVIVASV